MRFSVLFLLICSPLYSLANPIQPLEKVWKINYAFVSIPTTDSSVEKSREDLMVDEMMQAMAAQESGILMTAYVNSKILRVEERGFISRVQISNYAKNTSYILDSLSQSAYTTEAIWKDLHDETAVVESDLKLVFFPDTKIIAGRNCKRALMQIGNQAGQGIHIWYDETLPRIVWGDYAYLNQIPGGALEITANYDREIGIRAQSVTEVTLPLSQFEVPIDFEIFEATHFWSDDSLSEDEQVDVQKDAAFAFVQGQFWFQDATLGLFGIKDATGAVYMAPAFYQIESFSDGVAIVTFDDNKQGVINDRAELVVPYIYDELRTSSEGRIPFYKEHKWGFFNLSGQEIVPAIYTYVSDFSEGLALVSKGEKFGYINDKGKIVIPIKFDYASDFEHGAAQVEIDKESFSINKKGLRIKSR